MGAVSLRQRAKASQTLSAVDAVRFDMAIDTKPQATKLDEWLASKKCDADLVVDGLIVGALSSLTTDETSVFTDYEIEVRQTLYVRRDHQTRLPLVIVKPGGSIKLPEGLVTTVADQFSDLRLGHEYILFLRAPKNPLDAYFLDDLQQPGVLEVGQESLSVAKGKSQELLADWLKQSSVDALSKSSVWSSDTSRSCVKAKLSPQ